MNTKLRLAIFGIIAGTSMMAATSANADHADQAGCSLVSRHNFVDAANLAAHQTDTFGFGLPMWATLVDTSGKVCQVYSTAHGVANTGATAGNHAWLGSRVISAQKANGANAFSLNNLSLPSGAVYIAILPGGSLYGLQASNPVDASRSYDGQPADYGTSKDPLVGKRVGGINYFGGGVALYSGGVKVGAVGSSGDTSCRDHAFAYHLRNNLGLDDGIPNAGGDDRLKLVSPQTALFQQPPCGVNDPTNVADGIDL